MVTYQVCQSQAWPDRVYAVATFFELIDGVKVPVRSIGLYGRPGQSKETVMLNLMDQVDRSR